MSKHVQAGLAVTTVVALLAIGLPGFIMISNSLPEGSASPSEIDSEGLVSVPGIGLTNAGWAERVRSMLGAAARDGLVLSGSSYRDRASQVLLRRQHCGSSDFAIYEMPASSCSPPTARPGESRHEVGLAIDFDHCHTRSTRCYRWLAANAARYGLVNLPSEPWHWSHDGQ